MTRRGRAGVSMTTAPQDEFRPGPWTTVPFVVCFALALVSLALPPRVTTSGQWQAIGATFAVALAILVVAIRRTQRSWLDPVAPWLSFLLIALMRDGSGGETSGLAPLVGLPILWLALFGRRLDLAVAAVLTGLTFLLPMLLIGPPTYPASDWRRAMTWTALAVLVAPMVQRVVEKWEQEIARHRVLTAELRERERALVRARERAERMFEDAPQGLALLTTSGRVVQVNPTLCRMLERPAEEIVGRGLSSLGDNPLDRSVALHLDEVRQGAGDGSQAEWTARTPDGRRVFVALSSTLLTGDEHDAADTILVTFTDVSERHGYEEKLAHLADHDPLTGLANRRRFDAELARHLEYCRRYGPLGALIVLDLDRFKEVNDTLGHAAGDELIVAIGSVLRRGVRAGDLVARLGGDEFAVLLPQADRAGAEIVAQGIVDRVRGHVRSLEGTLRNVTASVGVVVIDAVNEDPGQLMAAADMTMYDAKDAGRDGYVVLDYADYHQPRTGVRMEWQRRVEEALAKDAFELYLQPILDLADDLADDVVSGAEVLLRMVGDGGELVEPSRFLDAAERSGLAVDLDCWVVEHGIALLAELRRVAPDFKLGVNISGRSIGHPALEAAVLAALELHGVAADGLVLEITETSAVADVESARRFAERMSQVGCEFALDDFGAGYGSFYYLKHLAFDYVKIDGEFVADCHVNPTDRLILGSIVGIARGLGKRTVAELVAEPAVLDVVRAAGVDLAQGHHVGRPLPAVEFLAQLAGRDALRVAR